MRLYEPKADIYFHGLRLKVSLDIRYIAADRDGQVFGYRKAPQKAAGCWKSNEAEYIETVVMEEGDNWEETLLKLDN